MTFEVLPRTKNEALKGKKKRRRMWPERGGAESKTGKKVLKLATGVTTGVTNWGYKFQKLGLQIRGFEGYDREGGKGKKNAISGANIPFR